MRTKLSVAIALAGTLLATCLVSGSAQATSVPVLKVEGSSGIVTLVGRGGRGGGGRHYGGGGRHYGGGAVRRNYGYRGGGRNYGHRNYGHRNYGYGHRNYGYRGYRGGRWYGGRWWGYGVGTCWQWTPAGYVWICGY